MKLAHLADWHLGFRRYQKLTASGLNQRESDVAASVRRSVDGVIEARPDAVIVAGDLFHSVRPSNHAIIFACREFGRMREALPDSPIVVLAGNHESARTSESGNILRLLEEFGCDVAVDRPRYFQYPAKDLAVLAVPHATLAGRTRERYAATGTERYQVLALHGDVEGMPDAMEYGGAYLSRQEIDEAWHYVAVGHYHVCTRVQDRVFYCGAPDYVSSNVWDELAQEAKLGLDGKSWLLADLATGEVERRPIPRTRTFHDVGPLDMAGKTSAEVDQVLAEIVTSIGGVRDRIIRVRLTNVAREIERGLDHGAIRFWKSEALDLGIECERPVSTTTLTSDLRRKPLDEVLADFLADRELPPGVDREEFVKVGRDLFAEDMGEAL